MPNSRILIVDDDEINRDMLDAFLSGSYDCVQAADGGLALEIVEKDPEAFSCILLDLMMPNTDGFSVLEKLRTDGLIDFLPVIVISSANDSAVVTRAFDLGARDYIPKPFEARIVQIRVNNMVVLFARQEELIRKVINEVKRNRRDQDMLIDVLSHIVEFRNQESGLHVKNIRTITGMLLETLIEMTDCAIGEKDIPSVAAAASLHDIGKLAVPEEILNKPGPLTEEEFEIMKTHTINGAKMIRAVKSYENEPLMKYAYEICRWHHERWDGRGYPDGLRGDAIPLSAQVVAMADVYDALTSDRVYKHAFSYEKAISMILGGECGAFNPLLVKCLCRNKEKLLDLESQESVEFEDKILREVRASLINIR